MANQVVSLPSNKPDTEVSARPRRRTYTAPYKLKVLDEVAAATERGAVAVILRREGLYASHLAAWRKELRNGGVGATYVVVGVVTHDDRLAARKKNGRIRFDLDST